MKKTLLIAALAALVPTLAVALEPNVSFTLDAVKDLRERARYPEWSQPVAPGGWGGAIDLQHGRGQAALALQDVAQIAPDTVFDESVRDRVG